MATEKASNNGVSTLDGAIDDSVTSLTVATGEGSRFPTTGNFRVIVDNEIMLCTARSGDVLTVTRGHEDTAAASHADVADISHIITADAQVQFHKDSVGYGLIGSLPATPERTGRVYFPSNPDGGFAIAKDNSTWKYFGVINGPFDGVDLSAFATYDTTQSDDTVQQRGPFVHWKNDGITPGGENVRARMQSIPGGYTTWTITAAFRFHPGVAASYSTIGFGFRNSSNNNIMQFCVGPRADVNMLYLWYWYNSATSYFEAVPNTQQRVYRTEVSWIKVTYDGTDFKMYASTNGRDWCFIASRASGLGFGTPTQWGMLCNPYNASSDNRYVTHADFYHLKIENGVV